MTTIYLVTSGVTSGEYSSYGINAIFSTKEGAELYISLFGDKSWAVPEIEEWEMDEGLEEAKNGLSTYQVQILKDGTVQTIHNLGWPRLGLMEGIKDISSDSWWFFILAKDEMTAIKIANERRTQLLAFDQWETGKQ